MEKNLAGAFRVMCVEDDPHDVFFIRTAFQEADTVVDLQVFTSGLAGLEYLRNAALLPEIVLLDLKLPILSGFEVLEAIREDPRLRNLAVIICSSSHDPRDIERACRIGVNAYVVKPTSCSERLELVQSIIAFWGKWNVTCKPEHSLWRADEKPRRSAKPN